MRRLFGSWALARPEQPHQKSEFGVTIVIVSQCVQSTRQLRLGWLLRGWDHRLTLGHSLGRCKVLSRNPYHV